MRVPPQASGRRLLLPVAALVVASSVLSACTVGGDDDALPELRAIPQAWEVEGVTTAIGGKWEDPAIWRTDDSLISVSYPDPDARITTVTSLDLTDGSVEWSDTVDGVWCGVSDGVNSAGQGALLLTTDDRGCNEVALVDTAAQSIRWSTPLTSSDATGDDRVPGAPTVDVTDDAVLASDSCGGLGTFALADGTKTGRVVSSRSDGFSCFNGGAALDGTVVSQVPGPGGRPSGTTLSDGDGQVWRTPKVLQTNAVVTTDPVVLDVTERNGRVLRRFDDRGRPGPPIGLSLTAFEGFHVVAQADGVLVGTYPAQTGTESLVYAYDLTSGELLWKRSTDRFGDGRRLFGSYDGRLVWGQSADLKQGDEGYPGDQLWITLSDARDPDSGTTLGQISQEFSSSVGGLFYVSGDLLLQPDSQGITAYPLDGSTTDGVSLVPASRESGTDDTEWGPEDVRPEAVVDACTEITDAPLHAVGLSTDLPAPVNCSWSQSDRRGLIHRLSATVGASEPGKYADGTRTGPEQADQVLDQTLESLGVTEDSPGVSTLDGLGDRAVLVSRPFGTLLSGDLGLSTDYVETTATSTQLLVRQGNVVVNLQASVEGPLRQGRNVPSVDVMEAAAGDAVRDIFAAVDVPLPDVAPVDASPVTSVPDACRRLTRLAAPLVAGAEPIDLTAARIRGVEPAAGGCAWLRTYRMSLQAQTIAYTSGPLDGADATARATALLDDVSGTPVSGLGDQAVRVALTPSSYSDATGSLVLARRDNLVVLVRYTRERDSVKVTQQDAKVRAIAARLLRG